MHVSIHTQVDRALSASPWKPEELNSLRSAMPGTGARKAYYDAAGLFFIRAKALSGYKRLAILLDPEIIRCTFDQFYFASKSGTLNNTLEAINKVYLGCQALCWIHRDNPLTMELRSYIQGFSVSLQIP